MHNYLAQKICIGGQCVTGALPTTGPGKINTLADLVNKIVNFLIPLAAVILLFVFIWGGYDYMMSQGAPDKIKSAQAKFTTGIIGLVLLLLAYVIVRTIGGIFGLAGGII